MKIALILSGQPRFYNSVSYTTIYNEILNKYDTDVFFHCWYSSNKDYNYEYSPNRQSLLLPIQSFSS